MNKLLTSLALLSMWLAGPVLAADGDSCNFVTTAVTSGTTTGKDIPMPASICSTYQAGAGVVGTGCAVVQARPQIDCRLVCDKTAAGAFQCGPMWIPGGGQNAQEIIIRAISGTENAAACGYDDVNVYTLSNTNVSAPAELPSIGLLDNDGSSSGVKQISVFGPVGPYIYLSGTAGTAPANNCDASHRLQIQLLLYHNQNIQ